MIYYPIEKEGIIMTFVNEYHQFVMTTLETCFQKNEASIHEAAKLLYECEINGGRIYTFGTGHSHMLGQDLYGRAGGYAKIYPILEGEMTLLTHPVKSTKLERIPAYADVLENLYDVKQGDVIIAASNSGRNGLVIEYLSRMKNKGVKIIGITSLEHSKSITSRHESGLRLFELADVVLDNFAPHGDAGVALSDKIKMGPLSTLSGCYLSQFIIGEMVELLIANGYDAPVFRSSNIDGADAYNQELFDQYVIKKI